MWYVSSVQESSSQNMICIKTLFVFNTKKSLFVFNTKKSFSFFILILPQMTMQFSWGYMMCNVTTDWPQMQIREQLFSKEEDIKASYKNVQ